MHMNAAGRASQRVPLNRSNSNVLVGTCELTWAAWNGTGSALQTTMIPAREPN